MHYISKENNNDMVLVAFFLTKDYSQFVIMPFTEMFKYSETSSYVATN